MFSPICEAIFDRVVKPLLAAAGTQQQQHHQQQQVGR